jgi:hypothetical protein
MFIDGDFPTKRQCPHHCSPTCHPVQVGPKWVYGCLHPSWQQNKDGDFCPIVKCNGRVSKCELSSEREKARLKAKVVKSTAPNKAKPSTTSMRRNRTAA